MATAARERVPHLLPGEPAQRKALRREVIRVLVAANLMLGTYYLIWRWTASVNWAAWYIAVPLILAETYSYIDAWLFGITMWRIRERGDAPQPPAGATVDVLITCYNEPVELVAATARAAKAIRYPHETYILDDGASPEMQAAARAAGVGYITRSPDWRERPRHAKAGNLNNALFQTQGEFLLILDADQVPAPSILDRTLGWFRDPRVALVQTPQWFNNVTKSDPLGSQAPLFYGPIQQGKDGWNAAFFCGSNAILRREALMQLGIIGYVVEAQAAARRVLRTAGRVVSRAQSEARRRGDEAAVATLARLSDAVDEIRAGLGAGMTLQDASHRFRREVDRLSQGLVRRDVEGIRADLEALLSEAVDTDVETGGLVVNDQALDELAARELSPLAAIESVSRLVGELDAVRSDEAQPIMPMATISVTEDMATAMRLHSHGWSSVYHHEVLAEGLAPEDLRSMLAQRLRWAQGTLQVMLRENPVRKRGLSTGQRLMYLATMWSYLSGFAALAYIAAPILYLCFGIKPVNTFGGPFVWHLLPYLIVNQLLFAVVSHGMSTWRGQQYSLALFPLWITACTSALANVALGRKLGFVVTPKTRQAGVSLRLVRAQLVAMGALVMALVVGLTRLMVGATTHAGPILVNVCWVIYDLISLSVVIDAAYYQGFAREED